MVRDVLLLLLLIAVVMGAAWRLDTSLEQRRRQRRCPVCRGIDRREAFKDRGYIGWCEPHQDAWFDVESVWDRGIDQ